MLLIIDNYDSFTFNLYQLLAQQNINIKVVRNDQINLQTIRQLAPAGIVLSPGPGRPENAGICVELIRALNHGELGVIPLLGVCLGHQALVVALGGEVIGSDEICHGKSDLIYHQQTEIYQTLSTPFQAGRYHSLIADKKSLPSCLEIEAVNAQGLIMGLRHRFLPLFGVQFHPESILTPDGAKLLGAFMLLCKRYQAMTGAVA